MATKLPQIGDNTGPAILRMKEREQQRQEERQRRRQAVLGMLGGLGGPLSFLFSKGGVGGGK